MQNAFFSVSLCRSCSFLSQLGLITGDSEIRVRGSLSSSGQRLSSRARIVLERHTRRAFENRVGLAGNKTWHTALFPAASITGFGEYNAVSGKLHFTMNKLSLSLSEMWQGVLRDAPSGEIGLFGNPRNISLSLISKMCALNLRISLGKHYSLLVVFASISNFQPFRSSACI